ncbi:MAG: hypothetical protein ACFFBD_24515 [Candidatus Hodarchaeota archaeon]
MPDQKSGSLDNPETEWPVVIKLRILFAIIGAVGLALLIVVLNMIIPLEVWLGIPGPILLIAAGALGAIGGFFLIEIGWT